MVNLKPSYLTVGFSLLLMLSGCDGSDTSQDSDGLASAVELGKVQDDSVQTRLISINLTSQQDLGYVPLFEGRIVMVEPMMTVPVTVAKGEALQDGINIGYIGESCSVLQQSYPDITACTEEETVKFEYGEVESTVITDSSGFASVYVGAAENYRISVNSWATEEDAKCFWNGQEVLDASATEVTVEMVIFCE